MKKLIAKLLANFTAAGVAQADDNAIRIIEDCADPELTKLTAKWYFV